MNIKEKLIKEYPLTKKIEYFLNVMKLLKDDMLYFMIRKSIKLI